MTLENMKSAIKTRLESVTGIGNVHTYNRNTVDWQEFYKLFKDANGRINTWLILWQGLPVSEIEATGSIFVRREYSFKIVGLYSLKDEDNSSNDFDNLVELIVNEFDGTRQLGSGSLPRYIVPATTTTPTERMFSNYLVHTIEINLTYEDDYGTT